MNALVTILARGGSKGIPNKALTVVHGRSLLEWTLRHAIQFAEYPIVVSSDSQLILDHATNLYPTDVATVLRPPHLSNDTCPKMSAIAWTVEHHWGNGGLDAVIDLDICNPMRTWRDIGGALEIFTSYSQIDSVVSVTPARRHPAFNMVRSFDDGYGDVDLIVSDGVANRRQDTPQVWDLNSCIYIYSPKFLSSHTHPVGGRTYCYPMPPHTFCDIDTPLDLSIVTHLMKEYGYAE